MAEISGIPQLRTGIASSIARQRAQLVADLDALGRQMVEAIRAAAPRRTGALAASVRHEVVATPDGVRLQIVVGNDTVFYAPFVEFGTAGSPAHAFVRPVLYRDEKTLPGRIEHSLSTSWATE